MAVSKASRAVSTFLQRYKNLFMKILHVHEYITATRMDKEGMWATEVEILATAHMLKTAIYTSDRRNKLWCCSSPNIMAADCQSTSSHDIYINNPINHFEPVLSV